MIVAVIGPVVVLVAVNPGTFPVPLAAKPLAVLEFVQAYVVPATGPEKFVGVTTTPLHTTILAGTVTVGVGFTVMV